MQRQWSTSDPFASYDQERLPGFFDPYSQVITAAQQLTDLLREGYDGTVGMTAQINQAIINVLSESVGVINDIDDIIDDNPNPDKDEVASHIFN